MPWAIELCFDPAADAHLREAWNTLAPIAGSDYLLRQGVHPHCALAVFDELPAADALLTDLENLARGQPVISLQVRGINHFATDPAVLYLALQHGPALLDLHARVANVLERHGRALHPYYQVDRWVAHCTLAQQVALDRLPMLEQAARNHPWPAVLRTQRLVLVAFPPTRLLGSQAFADAPA